VVEEEGRKLVRERGVEEAVVEVEGDRKLVREPGVEEAVVEVEGDRKLVRERGVEEVVVEVEVVAAALEVRILSSEDRMVLSR
jgi:hypothetical protein